MQLNAVTSGVADVRKVISDAQERRAYGQSTYLLLDECHRWSKAQSDSILPAIERGIIRFIGSTTENPMVSMTPAIVSRCRVFQFEPLTERDVLTAMRRAIDDPERGYGQMNIIADDDALRHIARIAGGDTRAGAWCGRACCAYDTRRRTGQHPHHPCRCGGIHPEAHDSL